MIICVYCISFLPTNDFNSVFCKLQYFSSLKTNGFIDSIGKFSIVGNILLQLFLLTYADFSYTNTYVWHSDIVITIPTEFAPILYP